MYFVIVDGVKYEFKNLVHAEIAYKAWKEAGLNPFIRDSLGFAIVFVDVTIIHEDPEEDNGLPSEKEINEIWESLESIF